MANRFEQAERGVTYGLDNLIAYCAELNRYKWVQASGMPYFINQRNEEGRIVHFIDRRTQEPPVDVCTTEQAREILREFGLTSLGGFKA